MDDSATQDARKRPESSVKTFFELEDMQTEWDMFATRGALDAELHKRSRLSKCRDGFFMWFRRKRNPTVECWYERFQSWDRHLSGYLTIEGVAITPTTTAIPAHGTKRVDKLFDYLKVLDTKLSMAFAINSLVLAASYFLVGDK